MPKTPIEDAQLGSGEQMLVLSAVFLLGVAFLIFSHLRAAQRRQKPLAGVRAEPAAAISDPASAHESAAVLPPRPVAEAAPTGR